MFELATPLWVNISIVVPFLLWFYFKNHRLSIERVQLLFVGLFAAAFGFIEGAVVIYLRASIGVLPGFQGSLMDVQRAASNIFYDQQILATKLPPSLLSIEVIREAFTMVMLLTVTLIAAKKLRERTALFLFAFVVWDFFYYVFLYLLVRWPQGLTTKDLFFLIPQPWFGQVWLPILLDILIAAVILVNVSSKKKNS